MASMDKYEDALLRIKPLSEKATHGREIIKAFFKKNPNKSPKETSVDDISEVIVTYLI